MEAFGVQSAKNGTILCWTTYIFVKNACQMRRNFKFAHIFVQIECEAHRNFSSNSSKRWLIGCRKGGHWVTIHIYKDTECTALVEKVGLLIGT